MAEACKKSRRDKNAPPLPPRFLNYVSESLSDLTERLVKCSKEENGVVFTTTTRDVVYVLKVHRLRNAAEAHAFRSKGGVAALLALLSLCSGREGKDRGLVVSTLGNVCALDRGCRDEVRVQVERAYARGCLLFLISVKW